MNGVYPLQSQKKSLIVHACQYGRVRYFTGTSMNKCLRDCSRALRDIVLKSAMSHAVRTRPRIMTIQLNDCRGFAILIMSTVWRSHRSDITPVREHR